MSAGARNYVYHARVTNESEQREPMLSKEKMDEYEKNVEKYLNKDDTNRK